MRIIFPLPFRVKRSSMQVARSVVGFHTLSDESGVAAHASSFSASNLGFNGTTV